ncbi:conserved hypothetical protein [Candidatus Defluviicoccus seviourii]|uniref:DUF2760 domain-containing protein n=1 Tax=Candidatus Defluviicoccus seviourii TaxID=2565273 RepID=A0A564WCN6_9PROT|nr:conserved hypothetical protein [Candidatus Defluviicoccus seviourii]
MRALLIVLALALLALVGLTLVPEAAPHQFYLTIGALAIGGIILLTALFAPSGAGKPVVASAPVAAAAPPPPEPALQAEAEIVSFLALLQEKGRLVDFVMDDITAYPDAQVGAAARVVQAGCKAVLAEHFRITPVRTENEGAKISVPTGYPADAYRLVGRISGEPPFSGTLVHRGWQTDKVKLPRVVAVSGDRLPAIAPAEVELK